MRSRVRAPYAPPLENPCNFNSCKGFLLLVFMLYKSSFCLVFPGYAGKKVGNFLFDTIKKEPQEHPWGLYLYAGAERHPLYLRINVFLGGELLTVNY